MTQRTPPCEVLIVGAGPSGLMLAGELALAGVKPILLERRPDQRLAGLRAGGLHSRTLEILEQRGIADRFIHEGQVAQVASFAGTRLDISDFPTPHPYGLGLRQNHIERLLADWILSLGVTIHYGMEVATFSQDAEAVEVQNTDGRSWRASYVIGCDGGHSLIRKLAEIPFSGTDPTMSHLIAEVEMADDPPMGMRHDATGQHAIGRVQYEIRDGQIVYASEGPLSIMLTEQTLCTTPHPTLDDLREALRKVYSTDFGVHSPTWISRFTDGARQAETYRKGRVFLVGDAAHVHPPDGGQGLNLGVQDAVNLGWKLARVARGISPDTLLDTYHAERHPVGARVLRHTLAAVALRRPDGHAKALRDTFTELLTLDAPRRHMAAEMSGLNVHHNLGEGHPLLGRRMPNLPLDIDNKKHNLFELLHEATPLLLDFGASKDHTLPESFSRHIRTLHVSSPGPWTLPVLGDVPAPARVLVRPDGYVAWVDGATSTSLKEVLSGWFGTPQERLTLSTP